MSNSRFTDQSGPYGLAFLSIALRTIFFGVVLVGAFPARQLVFAAFDIFNSRRRLLLGFPSVGLEGG